MALQQKQKIRTTTLPNAKDVIAELIVQEVYAARAAATATTDTDVTAAANGNLVPFLCPLYFDTVASKWKVWTDGQTIDGFAYGDEGYSLHASGKIKLDTTDDVIGLVLKGGTIPYDQVPLPFGELQADLKTALTSGMRSRSFHIVNIGGVH